MERCHLEPVNTGRGDFRPRMVVGELPPMDFSVIQLNKYAENTAITFLVRFRSVYLG